MADQQKHSELEKQHKKNEKKYFVPYLRTNGFAWSSRGQMVYFSYPKYAKNFKEKKSYKKRINSISDFKNILS